MGSKSYSDPEIVRRIREIQHDLAVARLLDSPVQELIKMHLDIWRERAKQRNIQLPEEVAQCPAKKK